MSEFLISYDFDIVDINYLSLLFYSNKYSFSRDITFFAAFLLKERSDYILAEFSEVC